MSGTAKDGGRILLVAGGTGGHIWPAVSFGKWVAEKKHNVSVGYVCGNRPLEKEIYGAACTEPYIVDMSGSPLSSVSIAERFRRLKEILKSFGRAKKIIKDFNPDCCVLFGGYLSLPFLIVCKAMKVPVVVHEQNAYAGRVTRVASFLRVEVLSGWSDCKPLSAEKFIRVGVPVRNFEKMTPEGAWAKLGFSGAMPPSPRVVVFTGSLGSGTVKEQFCDIAGDENFKGWTFLIPAVSNEAERVTDGVYLLPRIWDPSPLFSLADITVVRGGGSTLTEAACTSAVPLVLPWRKAANDHQYHNAISFLSENKGIMMESERSTEELTEKLLTLDRIRRNSALNTERGLYNDPSGICESLWLALVSHF